MLTLICLFVHVGPWHSVYLNLSSSRSSRLPDLRFHGSCSHGSCADSGSDGEFAVSRFGSRYRRGDSSGSGKVEEHAIPCLALPISTVSKKQDMWTSHSTRLWTKLPRPCPPTTPVHRINRVVSARAGGTKTRIELLSLETKIG